MNPVKNNPLRTREDLIRAAVQMMTPLRECLTPGRAREDAAHGVLMGEYGIVTPLLGSDWPEGQELDGQEECLYAAMKQLYEDPSVRERYRAQSRACIERYKPEVIARQWLEVIR